MTVETEVALLTAETTALLAAVNERRAVLDTAAQAAVQAAAAARASEQAAAQVLLDFNAANTSVAGGVTEVLGTGALTATAGLSATGTKQYTLTLAEATPTESGAMSTADKTKLDGIAAEAAVLSVNGGSGDVVITAQSLGLGQVADLAPMDFPINTLTQAALDLKDVAGAVAAHVALTNPHPQYTTAQQVATIVAFAAPIDNPTFTGNVSVPTRLPGNNLAVAASTEFVMSALALLEAQMTGLAPGVLNTFEELAVALGNNPNFAEANALLLAARLRIDTATQGLTALQKANALTNLGIELVENKSSATIRGELTAGNVVDALAYTPGNRAGDTFALANIVSGAANNFSIGATTPDTGAFTTLKASAAITSTVAEGTPPLVLGSKTKVVNLNADLLDGGDWATPGALGSATPNTAKVTSLEVGLDAHVAGALGVVGALTVLADSEFNSMGATKVSTGTTVQRPANAKFGMMRGNTDIGWYEAFNGQYWYALGGTPIGSLFALNYTYIGPLAEPITSITCTPPAMTPNGVTMDYSSVWTSTLVIPPTNILTTSITFTNLQGITGSMAVTGLTALAAFNFPVLTTIVGSYVLTGMPALTGVIAPLLDQVGANFTLANNIAMAAASFPMLGRIGNNFSLSKLAGCVSFSFPQLHTVGGNFHIDGLTACTSVNFSSLTEVKGSITVSDAAALTALSFPSLERVGTALTGGNAVTLGPLMAGVTVFEFSNALKQVNGSVYISCALSVVQVNNLLVQLARLDGSGGTTAFSNMGVTLTGVCGIPSLTGLTAKTVLQARGCVVITN